MIPNLYLESGCCTKHPFKIGCLGFQVGVYMYVYIYTYQTPGIRPPARKSGNNQWNVKVDLSFIFQPPSYPGHQWHAGWGLHTSMYLKIYCIYLFPIVSILSIYIGTIFQHNCLFHGSIVKKKSG